MASVSSEKVPEGLRTMAGGKPGLPSTIPPASQCSYAACYCEENVYKICQSLANTEGGELTKAWAVFVSNKKRVVPLWRQKAGRDEEKLVIWDYHVILIYRPDTDRYNSLEGRLQQKSGLSKNKNNNEESKVKNQSKLLPP